jgi:hypothetical protein
MKWMSVFAFASILLAPMVWASEPVTLSSPNPPIAASYSSGSAQTVIYTVTNYVNKALPVTVSGLSNGVSRTTVSNDCGNMMPAGPSTCQIGVLINPSSGQAGTTINQTMVIDYQGRTTLSSSIIFQVTGYVYFTPSASATAIYKASVDPSTGQFGVNSVAYTAVSPQGLEQFAFATVGGTQYAYVLDQTGYVYQCPIDTNGNFTSCTSTPTTGVPSWNPRAIAFTVINNVQYAYVADLNYSYVYQCAVVVDPGNPTNGNFSSCTNATPTVGFDAPYGIAFAVVDGVQFLYVADVGMGGGAIGALYRCSLDTSGIVTACVAEPQSSAPNWAPISIAFSTSGGTQYAYVSNAGASVPPNVYRCTITVGGLQNGGFSSCAITPTSSVPLPNNPIQVAFATMGAKKFAYIANDNGSSSGGINVCPVNTDGTFASCSATTGTPPVVGWLPIGVGFR